MSFAYVCVRICAMYAPFCWLYGFCVRLCTALCNVFGFAYVVWLLCINRLVSAYTDLLGLYDFCTLRGLCIRMQILRVKRLVRTDTDFVC